MHSGHSFASKTTSFDNSSSSSTAIGIPRDVLLDERNSFVPPGLAFFARCVVAQPTPQFYYWEFEVIWQAVSLPSWYELAAYVRTIALDLKARVAYLSEQRSYNFLSSEVRSNWKELWHLRNKVSSDQDRIYNRSGFGKPAGTFAVIGSDDLRVRLAPFGGLPSLAEHRKQFQDHHVADPSQRFGPLTEQEKRHLRAFGIHFDSEPDDTTDFEHVVDTRSSAVSKTNQTLVTTGSIASPTTTTHGRAS
ncbi:BQ2448_6622 [Microbotryum intermedium]|uniref:BQ2448_6622 protein n=1 Tax=Microbotryum intermedium TaxID=269621 RepID=A0A238FK68_9BASI|nr:BQ2448_6622 [Microbotryum intermedium]